MSNRFVGDGNLGDNPALKTVTVKGEDRKVAEMRVFFGEYRSDGNGGVEQSGGFWLTVSVWDRLAENVAQHLRKGARVHVEGRLQLNTWEKDGEEFESFSLSADDVTLKLSRLENVAFRAKRDEPVPA